MKSLWFNDVKNIDELKKRYKELCKQHHPDLGGSNENMQMINYAYERCLNELKSGSGHSSERIRDEEEIEGDLMAKIQEIVAIAWICFIIPFLIPNNLFFIFYHTSPFYSVSASNDVPVHIRGIINILFNHMRFL